MRLLMNIYRYVPSIRDSLYILGCYRLAELHIVESSLGYILIHRLRTYKMHNQNQVSKQKYWAFYLISWMGFKRNDQPKIYNHMPFSTKVLKVTFKQIYFEHVGEIHHYITETYIPSPNSSLIISLMLSPKCITASFNLLDTISAKPSKYYESKNSRYGALCIAYSHH
jgi:hypothetical protein